MKRFLSLLLAAIMVMSLVACGGKNDTANDGGKNETGKTDTQKPDSGKTDAGKTEEKSEYADKDELNYGMHQEPAKLDPQADSLLVTCLTNRQIYDSLVTKDSTTGEILPSLATEWEWVDDVTLHMTLREDAYFHNGDQLTSEDVVYTIKRAANGAASKALFTTFDTENCKALDTFKVEIKMKQPFGAALSMLSTAKACIVSKNYCESVDENTFNRQPIGTGPFKFVEWVTGERITLERNDNYWGQTSSYKTLNLRPITDATARAIELESGGLDILDSMNSADLVRFEADPNIDVYTVAGTKINYFVTSEADPVLSNPKVREAFAHAIDQEGVCAMGFGETAAVATSTMASTITGYKNMGLYEYNLDKAKACLKEAGYENGFEFVMVVPSMNTNIKTAEAIQACLSQIGVTMNIETYDAATWQSMSRDGSAVASLQNLTVDSFDPDHTYMNLTKNSSMAISRTSDAKLNELLDAGRAELDPEKRNEIYAEVQEYMYANFMWIPIAEPIINYAAQPYVKGFVPHVGIQPSLNTVYFE